MKCDLPIELLNGYLDGELDEHEKALVETHLKTCPSCQRELDLLKQIDGQLRTRTYEEPTREFTFALNQRVMDKIHTRRLSFFRFTPVLAPVAAALLILIILMNTRASGRIAGITDRIEYKATQTHPVQLSSVPELGTKETPGAEKGITRAESEIKLAAKPAERSSAREEDEILMDKKEAIPYAREQVVRAIIDTTGTIIKVATGNTLVPERDTMLEKQLAGRKVSAMGVTGGKQQVYLEVAAEPETEE